MIKIEFPADRLDIARAMSRALLEVAGKASAPIKPESVPSMSVEDAKQLAEDLTSDGVEVAHESPKQPATSLFDEPSAGTAGDADEAGTDQPTTPPEASRADASKLDLNGVAFNAAYCGEATEPFYTTGKMRGQWKKKRGVDQADYDAWYAAEQQKGGPSVNAGSAFAAPVNSAAAFGGQPPEPEDDTPADAGSLMVWVSEKQAAGLISQEDVNAAWGAVGVASPADLFGPNATEAVRAVFQHLKAKV